jgi:chromosome segregation ATPase
MATYLGRNVNLTLMVIIIGVVIALVATTVFFQRGLQNRTQAYESTSTTLLQCETALSNYQKSFQEAQQRVNETSQDIRKYDQLYEQKTSELKDTQTQLQDTLKELQFEKLQKEKFKQFYEAEQRVNAQLNATVRDLQDDIETLEDRYDQCRAELNACG